MILYEEKMTEDISRKDLISDQTFHTSFLFQIVLLFFQFGVRLSRIGISMGWPGTRLL